MFGKHLHGQHTASHACYAGDIWWYDCNGARKMKKQDCSCGCSGGSCVTGACTPGQVTLSNCGSCSQKTRQRNSRWSGCGLKPGNACEWQNGSNWKCCGSNQWHFSLKPSQNDTNNCIWSLQCISCSGCGCLARTAGVAALVRLPLSIVWCWVASSPENWHAAGASRQRGLMNRRDVFSSPLFVSRIPDSEDLHQALAHHFVAESAVDAGVEGSIRGGWHSEPDLANRDEPLMMAAMGLFHYHFEAVIRSAYADAGSEVPELAFQINAWATVLQAGGYSAVHDHGAAHLSAVYWADAGNTDDLSGCFELVDPRRSTASLPNLPLLQERVRLRPSTGTIAVFPGYLQHFVHSYVGDRPRVSLAANATIAAGYGSLPTNS